MIDKLLILDIEISPSLAAVWGLWKQNINLPNLLGESEIMCFSAKWHGSKETIYKSTFHDGKEDMLRALHALLEESSAVVTYNGNRFDLKIINQEFLFANMHPPKPYHSVDLLSTMKRRFRGTSNKLDWWLRRLQIGQKLETGGAALWIDCMKGDAKAWNTMKEYNMEDVVQTENLLNRVIAWIPDMPAVAPTISKEGDVIPTCACGSTHIQRRGYKTTASGMHYRQYQCQKCGKWFRERTADKEVVRSPLVHAGQI